MKIEVDRYEGIEIRGRRDELLQFAESLAQAAMEGLNEPMLLTPDGVVPLRLVCEEDD